jgi:hypothetical protein
MKIIVKSTKTISFDENDSSEEEKSYHADVVIEEPDQYSENTSIDDRKGQVKLVKGIIQLDPELLIEKDKVVYSDTNGNNYSSPGNEI